MAADRSFDHGASGAVEPGGVNLTLERGLDMLEFLARAQVPASVEAIRSATGLPASSAYRILRSLVKRGWVSPTSDGRYMLGLAFIGLTGSLRSDHWLVELSSKSMRLAAERTGETVLLTVISGQFALCVARVEGSQLVRATLEPGTLLPLHSGASSLVLLASSQKEVIDAVLSRPLARYTEASTADPEELRSRLDAIQAAGYVVTAGEVDTGVTAIAVPVPLDTDSMVFQTVGPIGLSVVGPSDRLDISQHRGVLAELRRSAQTIADAVTSML